MSAWPLKMAYWDGSILPRRSGALITMVSVSPGHRSETTTREAAPCSQLGSFAARRLGNPPEPIGKVRRRRWSHVGKAGHSAATSKDDRRTSAMTTAREIVTKDVEHIDSTTTVADAARKLAARSPQRRNGKVCWAIGRARFSGRGSRARSVVSERCAQTSKEAPHASHATGRSASFSRPHAGQTRCAQQAGSPPSCSARSSATFTCRRVSFCGGGASGDSVTRQPAPRCGRH